MNELNAVVSWIESFGEALGRGVARGIGAGFSNVTSVSNGATGITARRGRPPKNVVAASAAGDACRVEGCTNQARSKGLCSKHYQAERRRILQGQ